MGLKPAFTVISSKSFAISIVDTTRDYDAVENPGGYGAPNPLKASITAILLQQMVLGSEYPTASLLTLTERTAYLNGTGIPTSDSTLKDGVYDIRALIGFAGASNLTATGGSTQFLLTSASTQFQEAVGFSINSAPTILYRIDRTKVLTVTGGSVTTPLPAAAAVPITIYYEAQNYAMVYDQGENCLLQDIAAANMTCECSTEEVMEALNNYALHLTMIQKFDLAKDYAGAHKIALHLQRQCNDCEEPCVDCDDEGSGTGGGTGGSTLCIAPIITVQPADVTINAGQTISLSVIATGTSLQYQWKKDGVAIYGETTANLNIVNAQNIDAGVYSVVVSNACGSIESEPADAVLTEDLTPVVITVHPKCETVALGGTVVLSVTATGSPTITYQWRKDGIEMIGETGQTLTITDVEAGDVADYDVVVTNDVNSEISDAGCIILGLLARWGWRDTAPTLNAEILALQGSGTFPPGGTITADFRANALPKYLVMAEPSTEPAKTKWFGDAINRGFIGDLNINLFGPPVIIGTWRVYVTIYKTYNTETVIEFRVS